MARVTPAQRKILDFMAENSAVIEAEENHIMTHFRFWRINDGNYWYHRESRPKIRRATFVSMRDHGLIGIVSQESWKSGYRYEGGKKIPNTVTVRRYAAIPG